jgi:hypothetical protein
MKGVFKSGRKYLLCKAIYSKGRDIIKSVTACFDEEARNKCLIVKLDKETNRAAGYMGVVNSFVLQIAKQAAELENV